VAQFLIIPVIDLKDGLAVRAVGGNRADYRPLATPLCPDGDLLRAATGLMSICPTSALYVADLDAIEGGAPQRGILRKLLDAFPEQEIWIDGGFTRPAAVQEWLTFENARPVLGSESMHGVPPALDRVGTVLSLDFRGGRFLGPPDLLAEPALWPQDVIVMCLHSVGAQSGPDFDRIRAILAAAGGRRVFAAGGVRHLADLEALADIGVAGVLISSALHSGAVSRADVASLIAMLKAKGRPKPPPGNVTA
jgi:phosphoribosylformimino-5-aminoimidazole carboxamide ribotide isomerase